MTRCLALALVPLVLTAGLVACTRPQSTPEQLAAARAQWAAYQEQSDEAQIAMIAEGLQLNPLADPAVRA